MQLSQSPSQQIKIALVLLNYNGAKYIPDLFSSLSQMDFPSSQCDIFFVDNASGDDSLKWIEQNSASLKHPLRIIKNKENLGFAEGNNIAIREALKDEYTHFVLLNVDTVVDKNWLKELITVSESQRNICAVQSLILLHKDPYLVNTSGDLLHYLGFGYVGNYKRHKNFINQNIVPDIGYASGASVMYKAAILREAGLLDEKFFMYHEDLELSWRMRMLGYKIVLAPRSHVFHKYQFSRNSKKWFFAERNRLATCFMLYDIRSLLILAPAYLFAECGILLFSLINGWIKEKLKSYIGFMLLTPHILNKRKHVQAIRKIKDKEIMAYMTSRIEFEEVKSPLISFIANPVLGVYFWIVKRVIWW